MPPPDVPNRTTSSAKRGDEILRLSKWNPSAIWLCLEILCIRILNRIQVTKGRLLESDTLWEQVQLIAGNAEQVHVTVIWGMNGL